MSEVWRSRHTVNNDLTSDVLKMEPVLRKGKGDDERRKPSSSCVSVECGNDNPTPSPASGSLQVEIENLKTLLAQRNAENGVLTEKIRQFEEELVWEIGASGDMVLEVVSLRELLQEKDGEIQKLRDEVLRWKEGTENYHSNGTETGTGLGTEIQSRADSEDKRVLQLFPDVLKIIIEQSGRNVDNCIRWRPLMPILTACRSVCKSWRDSVDLVMEEDSSQTDLCPRAKGYFLPELKQDFTPCPLKLSYSSFDNVIWNRKLSSIKRCLKTNSDFRPIPSHHLLIEPTVSYEADMSTIEFREMVTRILQVLGKQVWYLTVCFRTRFRDSIDLGDMVYWWLSKWFSLVPNIRSLTVYTCTWGTKMECGVKTEEVSFPKFDHLKTFQCLRNTPLLCYSILKNNEHISKLGLFPDYSKNALLSPNLAALDFPNLVSFTGSLHSLEEWKLFGKVSWKLEELSVDLQFFSSPRAKQFASGIEKFGKTLNSLTFNLANIEDTDQKKVKLNLPQLKRLHLITEDWDPQPLDTILAPLQNLETLFLELAVYPNGTHLEWPIHEEREYFVDYVNSFVEKETGWMKVPKLRHLKLAVKFNGGEIGDPEAFVVGRVGLPSVRFDVVTICEEDVYD